jgi:hypothetical protein
VDSCGGGRPNAGGGEVLRWSGADTKHTKMGRATPAHFNLEGIAWRSKGERRRSGNFSTAAMRKKSWERGVGSGSVWRNEEVRRGLVRLSTSWGRGPTVDTLPGTVKAGGIGWRGAGEGSGHVAHSWAGPRRKGERAREEKKNGASLVNSGISY